MNYSADSVNQVCTQLAKAGLPQRVMIDCSHANSNKDHTKQAVVCRDVASQIALGTPKIFGVMLESNLIAGVQELIPGKELTYGQSVTDACIGWEETEVLLQELGAAVRSARISTN